MTPARNGYPQRVTSPLHKRHDMRYTLYMRILLPLLLLATPVLAADPVGDVICADREEMLRRLKVEHGAIRQGSGLRGPEAVLEVWAVPATGDWTLVQSYADGRSCIVAIGEHWEGPVTAPDPA